MTTNGTHTANPEPYFALLRTTPAKTVCPNFFILDHARGCNFNCSYCFLRDSEYGHKERRIFSDTDRLLRELGEWLAQDDLETYMANAGNMADSLTFENERPMWGALIDYMRENAEAKGRPHCLLVVTKAGLDMCGAFLEREPCRNIVISFSINMEDAAEEHEPGAATTSERLAAAARLQELGWRVRIRLDPMIKGYDYAPLVESIRAIAPERVTLGTLRADPTLLPEVRDVGIFRELEEPEPGSIARYPLQERLAMYRPAVERLRDVTSLGLCEETEDVWRELGLDYINKTCNCNHV
ncbi:MAG: radical SAM protein [Planctomycetes bacterium]|nr:radical SAM protein [Planctomycetota bacterium]